VARLNEVLQRLGLNAKDAFVPKWTEQGPGHKREYEATVQLSLDAHGFQALNAVSPWMQSKRSAKAHVAAALLAQIPPQLLDAKGSRKHDQKLSRPRELPGHKQSPYSQALESHGELPHGHHSLSIQQGDAQVAGPLMPEANQSLEEVKTWLRECAPKVRHVLQLPMRGDGSGTPEDHERLDHLLAEAFLHKSFVSRGSHSEQSLIALLGCPVAHNERLAWLGDAVLQQEASRFVFRTYTSRQ